LFPFVGNFHHAVTARSVYIATVLEVQILEFPGTNHGAVREARAQGWKAKPPNRKPVHNDIQRGFPSLLSISEYMQSCTSESNKKRTMLRAEQIRIRERAHFRQAREVLIRDGKFLCALSVLKSRCTPTKNFTRKFLKKASIKK
jgi:hypothetical protein